MACLSFLACVYFSQSKPRRNCKYLIIRGKNSCFTTNTKMYMSSLFLSLYRFLTMRILHAFLADLLLCLGCEKQTYNRKTLPSIKKGIHPARMRFRVRIPFGFGFGLGFGLGLYICSDVTGKLNQCFLKGGGGSKGCARASA